MPPDTDWPATRRAIDTVISRARREIQTVTDDALADLGRTGQAIGAVILSQVQDSLDDIDQTIPPGEDDE